jgi:hypothetical protein
MKVEVGETWFGRRSALLPIKLSAAMAHSEQDYG